MDTPSAATIKACRTGIWAASSTLVGIMLSGPLALVALTKLHPQPAWQDAEVFARHFHMSQTLPYFVGFFLVGGYVVLMGSLHALANEDEKPRTASALAFTSAFAALVFLNYIVQTTVVPTLAAHYNAENAAILAQVSMSNPTSLGWALEMWAWGLLGVATWLVSPIFSKGRLDRLAASLLVANGAASVASALCTAVRPAWVMTTAGLVSYSLWNVLVFAMSAVVLLALRERLCVEQRLGPVSQRFLRAEPRHA
jgi:hypothetical protein